MYPRRDSNPGFRRERAVNLPSIRQGYTRREFLLPGIVAKAAPSVVTGSCPMTIDNTY